jgi:quercetin dioxygenase-like cupin family protein
LRKSGKREPVLSAKEGGAMPENNNVVKTNALDLKSFDERKFNPKAVYQSDQIRVILAYFKKGQFIPVHTPNIDVILCILEGEAEVIAGEERIKTKVNDLIIVPKGVKRGVRALTDLTVLHVVQPPPSEEDHKEVQQKMALGRFE